jgi:DNA-binding response OmpR family regulator
VSTGAVAGPILLVEADRAWGQELAEQLAADGFSVELARNAEHARILARETLPRLALLGELDPPRMSLALLEEIRTGGGENRGDGWDSRLPALVLGARSTELDVLRAFEAGADDYLIRSGGYLELRARMRALLRRTQRCAVSKTRLEVRDLLIDTRSRLASIDGRPIELRRLEFDLLVHLAREPHRVFAREELLGSVWGYRAGCSTRTVDSHASRLRRKLDPHAARSWLIAVRGVGYRLL